MTSVTKGRMNTPQQLHIPVLLDSVLSLLAPQAGESYLDLTAGYGGHARAVISRIGAANLSTLVDRDEFALNHLCDLGRQGAHILQKDFYSAARDLVNDGEKYDMILLDLGVSSPQLDRAERGFSFMKDGPLDMRMDQSEDLNAEAIVNNASEKELARIIATYGEESPNRSAKIARAIRLNRPFRTTTGLAEVIKKTLPGGSKIHPATRTFQALRIAVNDELGQLERTLLLIPGLLRPGGRVAVISFHSLEDRIVKQFFNEQSRAGYEAELTVLTRHPIAGKTYDVSNPRARSAKLRAAVKINR